MEEVTQEQLDAAEEAAMRAQITGGDLVVETPPTPEPVVEPEAEAEPETEVKVDATPERIEIVPGYTKEEFDSLVSDIPRVRKALDKAQGTYGAQLQALQAEISQLKSSKPAATGITLSKLSEEYPDLAKLLAEDLQSTAAPQVDLAAYQKELDDRIAGLKREFAIDKLESQHPDWQSVAAWNVDPATNMVQFGNMQFGNWVSQQPKEVQDVVLNSDDPKELSKVISDYKATLKAEAKLDVVKEAVQPKGIKVAPIAKSDDELEEEAMRNEMRKHAF